MSREQKPSDRSKEPPASMPATPSPLRELLRDRMSKRAAAEAAERAKLKRVKRGTA